MVILNYISIALIAIFICTILALMTRLITRKEFKSFFILLIPSLVVINMGALFGYSQLCACDITKGMSAFFYSRRLEFIIRKAIDNRNLFVLLREPIILAISYFTLKKISGIIEPRPMA